MTTTQRLCCNRTGSVAKTSWKIWGAVMHRVDNGNASGDLIKGGEELI